MKVLVVDIQGFHLKKEFFAKELAIFDGSRTSHYVFREPYLYNTLSGYDKKQVQYVTRHVHGLQYTSGNTPYDSIDDIVKTHLYDVDLVYVRGHQKKFFLDSKLRTLMDGEAANDAAALPLIVNVENLPEDGTPPPPTFQRDVPLCMEHPSNGFYMCSIRNCQTLYRWFRSCLPK